MINSEYSQLLQKHGIAVPKTVICKECNEKRNDFVARLQARVDKAGSNHIVAPISPLFPICKECRYEDKKSRIMSKKRDRKNKDHYDFDPMRDQACYSMFEIKSTNSFSF